ncbi:MAG: DUF4956 domain-containing protein [Sodaliphilus sp.]
MNISQHLLLMGEMFFVNLIFIWIITHFFYFKKSNRRDYYFTFVMIGIAIFFLMFFMVYMIHALNAGAGIGIGIGLFGIFSIMRYRTETIPVREMTYLFTIVCMSVVNSLVAGGEEFNVVQLAPNFAFLVAIWLCEAFLLKTKERTKYVNYDRTELITEDRRADLIADLQKRLGVEVTKVEVGSVDFIRDMALLKVHYICQTDSHDTIINQSTRINREEWGNFNQK